MGEVISKLVMESQKSLRNNKQPNLYRCPSLLIREIFRGFGETRKNSDRVEDYLRAWEDQGTHRMNRYVNMADIEEPQRYVTVVSFF